MFRFVLSFFFQIRGRPPSCASAFRSGFPGPTSRPQCTDYAVLKPTPCASLDLLAGESLHDPAEARRRARRRPRFCVLHPSADLADLKVDLSTWGTTSCPPHAEVALHAAPGAYLPKVPASVNAARRLPDFEAPFGWLHAITKGMRLIEGHKDCASHRHETSGATGPIQRRLGYLVAVLTHKRDQRRPPRHPRALQLRRRYLQPANHGHCPRDRNRARLDRSYQRLLRGHTPGYGP